MQEPLYPNFNEFILWVVTQLMPDGYDVTLYESRCNTFAKIKKYYKDTGRVLVSLHSSDCTIYGDPKVNVAFRAWHDYVHITHNLDFSADGERNTRKIQQDHVLFYGQGYNQQTLLLFCTLLFIEVDCQLAHYLKYREYVQDQRQFCKDLIQSLQNIGRLSCK